MRLKKVAGGTARTGQRRGYVATLLLLPAITDALELLVATAAALATAATATANANANATLSTSRAAAEMPAKAIGQMLSTATAFSRCCVLASPTEPLSIAGTSVAAAHQAKAAKQQKPNDPCACGSGKKFKKCCGAA